MSPVTTTAQHYTTSLQISNIIILALIFSSFFYGIRHDTGEKKKPSSWIIWRIHQKKKNDSNFFPDILNHLWPPLLTVNHHHSLPSLPIRTATNVQVHINNHNEGLNVIPKRRPLVILRHPAEHAPLGRCSGPCQHLFTNCTLHSLQATRPTWLPGY